MSATIFTIINFSTCRNHNPLCVMATIHYNTKTPFHSLYLCMCICMCWRKLHTLATLISVRYALNKSCGGGDNDDDDDAARVQCDSQRDASENSSFRFFFSGAIINANIFALHLFVGCIMQFSGKYDLKMYHILYIDYILN